MKRNHRPKTAHPPVRKRHAATTRAAILASARKAFARAGYDGAGVREIAKGAGVSAMLVNRYFGSKERLFAEVVADTMAAPTILTAEFFSSAAPGAYMAAALVRQTMPGATPLDGFRIMFHSSSSARAARIGREQIEKRYQKMLAEALPGKLSAERAALVLSLVAGVQVMRQMIGLAALVHADPAALAGILAPVLQRLIAGQ